MRAPWPGIAGIVISLGAAASGLAAVPADSLWKSGPIDPAALASEIKSIDEAKAQLPKAMRPAAEFEKLLSQIRSGADVATWKGSVETYGQIPGDDPVTASIRELAKYWQARVWMAEIDKALRKYYRRNVRFPETLDEVSAEIPEALRMDPWGEPWAYRPAAAPGFAGLAQQRYQIGPKRAPNLTNLAEAVASSPAAPKLQITLKEIAGAKTLEIRAGGEASPAVIQPGGRVNGIQLVFIGDHWALFADTAGFFTVGF